MTDRDKEFLEALKKFGDTDADTDSDEDLQMLAEMKDDETGDADDTDSDPDTDDDGFDDDDEAFFQALEPYGGAQMAAAEMEAGPQDMSGVPAVAALCRTWNSVRPIVRRVLSIVRRVPGIGGSLVNAVNTLTRLLDAICRGANPAALCRQWRASLRRIMVRIASIVGGIPFIGRRMRRAIQSLIAAIDAVCRLVSA